MVVSIEFLGNQRNITQLPCIEMPISEATRLADALAYVKNQYPELELEEGTTLITVNNEMATLDKLLKANDKILFMPYIHGG